MTIEEQQKAIREGLAAAFITTGRCYNCTKEAQDECAYCDADVALRYLTEKGAVLPHELCSRYTTCIHYPLMEKK